VKLVKKRSSTALIAVLVTAAALLVWVWVLMRPVPEYLVASQDLASGTRVVAEQLTANRIDLGTSGAGYLQPAEFRAGMVLTRPVLRGELLPASALADNANPLFTQLVVQPSTMPPAQVRVGNRVALWAAAANSVGGPRQLVSRAEVTALVEPQGLFSDSWPSVQLLIPRTSVAIVLQALATKQQIYLLPVS
jgi:hypothetical protein